MTPNPGSNPGQPERDFETKYAYGSPEYNREKDKKRKFQAWKQAHDKYVIEQLSAGASLEDLGIRDIKEGGKAKYQRLMHFFSQLGGLDPNFEYDIGGGMKFNRATSDRNAQWIPMSPQDWAEYNAQKAFGNYPGAYIDRLRADETQRMRSWMGGNTDFESYNTGYRHKESGDLYDQYGIRVDESGNRIGGAYGQQGAPFASATQNPIYWRWGQKPGSPAPPAPMEDIKTDYAQSTEEKPRTFGPAANLNHEKERIPLSNPLPTPTKTDIPGLSNPFLKAESGFTRRRRFY